jgi:hypothetical protein
MNQFEQLIFIYFISATTLAGIAVLWRNWLADHQSWKMQLQKHLGVVGRALTCGSCFTYWIALIFVLLFNPIGFLLKGYTLLISYGIQWMSLGWNAVFLRFLYVFLQESVEAVVHSSQGRGH